MDYYGLMRIAPRFPVLALLLSALCASAQTASPPAPAAQSSALDAALFYQLLLGELNATGEDPGAAFSLILDAARKTTDPRLYQRAVDLALKARSGDSALQAARAWRQALPLSREANRYVLQILIGMNRLAETAEPLKREITNAEAKERAIAIASIPRLFARASDKKSAAQVVEQALAEYLITPALGVAAWTTIGRMRMEAGDGSSALEAARKAQALDANAEGPVLLALALMAAKQTAAEALVKKYLDGKPQAEVRLEYARSLIEARRYPDAASQLDTLTSERPEIAEAWLMRGALALDDNRLELAETAFKRYLALVPARNSRSAASAESQGLVQAYLALAQIAEKRNDMPQAESWLARIDSPEELLNAQLRRAGILARQGKLDEARKLIRSQPEKTAADARQKLNAEVQLLREAKQYRAAYDLLSESLKRFAADADLSYDLAMMAEKLGRFDEMERLLRAVIASKPEYQHAYNALGYSLAERSIRLPEARQLVQKALELAPNDPYITDSLGWIEFKSGNLAEAQRILQAAYKNRPDPEIAAHLGEVLWVMGRREQALAIWREGMVLSADNETLLETLKRLRVKL
jgi:tetratricopeptide (TPR) repeat protein